MTGTFCGSPFWYLCFPVETHVCWTLSSPGFLQQQIPVLPRGVICPVGTAHDGSPLSSAISKPCNRRREAQRYPFSNLFLLSPFVIFGIGAPGSQGWRWLLSALAHSARHVVSCAVSGKLHKMCVCVCRTLWCGLCISLGPCCWAWGRGGPFLPPQHLLPSVALYCSGLRSIFVLLCPGQRLPHTLPPALWSFHCHGTLPTHWPRLFPPALRVLPLLFLSPASS